MNIIITGASKGLGFAIAKAFAADHHPQTFFLCARNEKELAESAENLRLHYPQQQVKTKACNMAEKEEITAFAHWILQETSDINIVVNNAGSFLPGGILTEEDNTLEKMMNINLYSAYHLTKALLPFIIKKGNGHIFNICSTAALETYTKGASYSISKFALMGFSKNLREELKPYNIKVTTVYPGAFWSESWEGSGVNPERIMEANDIAKLIYSAAHLSAQACVEEIILRPQLGDL